MYNGVLVLLFMTAFACRLLSVMVSIHKAEGGSVQDSDYATEKRIKWPWNDPMLISEAFFCVASVFAFNKMLFMFQVFDSPPFRIVKIHTDILLK